MDKEYTDVSVAEDTNCGYREIVKSVVALKTVCKGQAEIIKILKDEIVQLIKESEMHKQLIKNLFEQVTTLVTMALPNVPVDVWRKLVENTKSLGAFDKLYDGVERKTK